MLGARPHHELASYLAAFDVCVVPYVRTAYTRTAVPTKIGEYLAMGRPVVSTDLPEVRELAAEPGVLRISGPSPSSFANALAAAIATPTTPELAARRRAVAERLDWASAVERLSDLIEALPASADVRPLEPREARPVAGEAPAA
jgi:glycosyltransferase involved in cell wall biosynthesis